MSDINRISWAAIDVGFDVRLHKMGIAYPKWAGDGPALIEVDDKKTRKIVSKQCANKTEAVAFLRRHGYRVMNDHGI